MYWVFNKKQLDEAIDHYASLNTADVDEERAMTNLLQEFLNSEDMRQRGMLRGEDNA